MRTPLLAIALLAPAAHAQTVITFEDLLGAFPPGVYDLANPVYSDYYADRGLTLSATEPVFFSSGVTGGDPDNFDIDGTNGPSFIALYNPAPDGTLVFSFSGTVNLSIDMITSALIPGDVPVNLRGFRNGKIAFNTDTAVPGAAFGDPDGQPTTYTFQLIDQLHVTTTNDTFRGLAFDNLVFETVTGCSPADFNKDGVLNFFDITNFIDVYLLGCTE